MLENLVVELHMIFNAVLAAFFGLLIGLERKGGRRGAGSRTFALICMGSAVFTLLSVYGFPESSSPERIASQIVVGIGFIGAGVIWRQRMEAVHGITTAAGIWITAGVGIAIGLEFYILAFFTTILTMMILARGHPIETAKVNLGELLDGDK